MCLYCLPSAADTSQTIIHDGDRVKLIADDAEGRLIVRIDGQDAVYLDARGVKKARGGGVSQTVVQPVAGGEP